MRASRPVTDETDDLFEMANLSPALTGLPGVIYLTKRAFAEQDGVVWLSRVPACSTEGLVVLERINQYRLYQLAVDLRQIPGLGEDVPFLEALSRLRSSKMALLPYCGENPPLRLTVSLSAANELVEALNALEREIPKLWSSGRLSDADSGSGNEIVESWRFSDLRTALEKFEAVLSAECETRPAFLAPRRGIYDTEELVNAAENAISAALRPMLSGKANAELSSAGRCLVFGLYNRGRISHM